MEMALAALDRLRAGNQRFVQGMRSLDALLSQTRRADFVSSQQPGAAILGCSDSRVPVEIIFDQGLGDLFVIRVAGNIVAASQIGSLEFAVEQFGTRLIVVLGHTQCGAVRATVAALQAPAPPRSRGLGSIVDRVRPAVEGLLETELKHDPEALLHAAGRANVRMAVNALRYGSPVLEPLIQSRELLIVGAEYDLATGQVDFFDGVPPAGI